MNKSIQNESIQDPVYQVLKILVTPGYGGGVTPTFSPVRCHDAAKKNENASPHRHTYTLVLNSYQLIIF